MKAKSLERGAWRKKRVRSEEKREWEWGRVGVRESICNHHR